MSIDAQKELDDYVSSMGAAEQELANYTPPPPKPEPAKSNFLQRIGDVGITGLKSAIDVPEQFLGLADIPTSGAAGKLAENAGFRPKEAKQILDTWYSPAQQEANANVAKAKGFVPTLKAYAENPSTLLHQGAEQILPMMSGAPIARGIRSISPKVAPYVAGAITEGILTAGQNLEQVRQETPGGLLDPLKQTLPVVATGGLTAAIAAGSGRFAKSLGVTDIQNLIAGGRTAPLLDAAGNVIEKKPMSAIRNLIGTGITEGTLQELPQTVQEQIGQNYATDRPLTEGLGTAAAQGWALGTGLGLGGAAIDPETYNRASETPPPAEVAFEEQAPAATVTQPAATVATNETPTGPMTTALDAGGLLNVTTGITPPNAASVPGTGDSTSPYTPDTGGSGTEMGTGGVDLTGNNPPDARTSTLLEGLARVDEKLNDLAIADGEKQKLVNLRGELSSMLPAQEPAVDDSFDITKEYPKSIIQRGILQKKIQAVTAGKSKKYGVNDLPGLQTELQAHESTINDLNKWYEDAIDFKRAAAMQTHYQGNKREFIDKNASFLASKVPEFSNDIETIHDNYAGGGTYGLSLAATNKFKNLKRIVINEVDPLRAKKFETAVTKGADIVKPLFFDPAFIELSKKIRPLIGKSTSLLKDALDGAKTYVDVGDYIQQNIKTDEQKVALMALKDSIFSGRTAPWDRLVKNTADDASQVKSLYDDAVNKGIKVELTQDDALGSNLTNRIKNDPSKGLVLLDPPYHQTASGTYSAGDANYDFGSNEFLDLTTKNAKEVSKNNVIIYHNKNTPEVQAAMNNAFGNAIENRVWKRHNKQEEYLGIYNDFKSSIGDSDGTSIKQQAMPIARGIETVGGNEGVGLNAGAGVDNQTGGIKPKITEVNGTVIQPQPPAPRAGMDTSVVEVPASAEQETPVVADAAAKPTEEVTNELPRTTSVLRSEVSGETTGGTGQVTTDVTGETPVVDDGDTQVAGEPAATVSDGSELITQPEAGETDAKQISSAGPNDGGSRTLAGMGEKSGNSTNSGERVQPVGQESGSAEPVEEETSWKINQNQTPLQEAPTAPIAPTQPSAAPEKPVSEITPESQPSESNVPPAPVTDSTAIDFGSPDAAITALVSKDNNLDVTSQTHKQVGSKIIQRDNVAIGDMTKVETPVITKTKNGVVLADGTGKSLVVDTNNNKPILFDSPQRATGFFEANRANQLQPEGRSKRMIERATTGPSASEVGDAMAKRNAEIPAVNLPVSETPAVKTALNETPAVNVTEQKRLDRLAHNKLLVDMSNGLTPAVSNLIRNDMQRVLDASANGDIKTLKNIESKYVVDAGKNQGGGGAGPGKIAHLQPRRGGEAVYNAATIAIDFHNKQNQSSEIPAVNPEPPAPNTYASPSEALRVLSSKTESPHLIPSVYEQKGNTIVPKDGVTIPDVTKVPVKSVNARRNMTTGKIEMINTGTGLPVFPGATFKSTGEANKFFKATQAEQLRTAAPVTSVTPPVTTDKRLTKKSPIVWKGETWETVANNVVDPKNLDVRLRKEPIYEVGKLTGEPIGYSYKLTDGRRSTTIPDFVGQHIESLKKQTTITQPVTKNSQTESTTGVVYSKEDKKPGGLKDQNDAYLSIQPEGRTVPVASDVNLVSSPINPVSSSIPTETPTDKKNLTVAPYVYHATNSDALDSIKLNGLMRNVSRTNGKPTEYYHASTTEEDSGKWANALKKDTQLRFKATDQTKDGDYPTTKKHYGDVKPWDLEIKQGSEWKPLIEDKIRQPNNWHELGGLVNDYLPTGASFNHPTPAHIKEASSRLGISQKDALRAKTVYDSGDNEIVKGKQVPVVTGTLSGRPSVVNPVTQAEQLRTAAPVTSVTPPVTSVTPPVTSVTPPVTSVTPPVTSVTSVTPPVNPETPRTTFKNHNPVVIDKDGNELVDYEGFATPKIGGSPDITFLHNGKRLTEDVLLVSEKNRTNFEEAKKEIIDRYEKSQTIVANGYLPQERVINKQANNHVLVIPKLGQTFTEDDVNNGLTWLNANGFIAHKQGSGLSAIGDIKKITNPDSYKTSSVNTETPIKPAFDIPTLVEQYNASGRIATHHPGKKTISLDGGRSMPVKEAVIKMREVLSKPSDVKFSHLAPDTIKPDYKGEYFHGDQDVNKSVFGAGKSTIIKNPTRAKAYSMANEDGNNSLRGIRDSKGNLYVSSATSTLHDWMIDSLKLPKESDKLNFTAKSIYGYPRNIFADDKPGESKFSKSPQSPTKSTVDQITAMIPKGVKPMLGAGKLQVLQNIKDLPPGVLDHSDILYHSAWHGSPHDHNKFDSSKIGTGEGAQAFGHGLYFTDSKSIAEHYRDKLSASNNPEYSFSFKGSGKFEKLDLAIKLTDEGYAYQDIKAVLDAIKKWGYNMKLATQSIKKSGSKEQLELIGKIGLIDDKGKLYKVELAPTQDEYLDWDKPLSEQSQLVKDALLKMTEAVPDFKFLNADSKRILKGEELPKYLMDFGNSFGKDLYKQISRYADESVLPTETDSAQNNDKAASNYLHSIGIRGIRYKAEGGKSDANNYVIFSDEDVSINEKFSGGLQSAEGLYDTKNDKLYLFADNLNADNFNSVISHELFHRAVATDTKLKAALSNFRDDFQTRFDNASRGVGSAIELAAYRRVITSETTLANQREEFQAYIISEYAKSPKTFTGKLLKSIQDLISAIRMALVRAGLDFGLISRMTPSDLYALSRYGAAVSKESTGAARTTQGIMKSAQDAGYKGNDKGEAFEWLRAKAKGLDMSQAARMERAKAMGFDTDKVWYHGSPSEFEAFDSVKIGSTTDDGMHGKGFYFSESHSEANKWGGNVGKYYLKTSKPFNVKQFDSVQNSMRMAGYFDHTKEDLPNNLIGQKTARPAQITSILSDKGFDSVITNERDSPNEVVVFEPNQIRSINAAFDPDFKESGNLLASIRQDQNVIIGDNKRTRTPEQLAAFEKIGRTVLEPSLKTRIKAMYKDAGKRWQQGVFDQFAPIKELSEKAYMLARLSKGSTGAFEAAMRYGKLKINADGSYGADRSGGIIQNVFAPIGKETHDFLTWVAANRAEALLAEDREHLFDQPTIDALKTLADGTTDFDYTLSDGTKTRNRADIYKDTLSKFNDVSKNIMDMAEQSGLIDPESRSLWEKEFYVPFYRVIDEADGGVRGFNIKQGLIRQDAFKQLKGGTQKLNSDLLENTLMNWAHLIDASAKNRAAKATLEAAENMGAARKALPGEKKTVWYKDGGNKVEYKVDDTYLLTAISSLEYAGLRGGAMDVMSTFKHALTLGVTASPFFKIRNLIRDSVQSIATGNMSYNVAKNIKQGWDLTDKNNQEYVDALASGGLIRFGTMFEGSESKRVQQLIKLGNKDASILNDETKIQAFYDKVLDPLVSAYNEVGNRGEEINRMALYHQLLAQGKTKGEAALLSRDLMDFSLQGSFTSIRILTQIVPFMNARLQGLYKLGRATKEDKARMATVIGAVSVASLALLAAYHDDDDWKKREPWDRDNYWWFKFGGVAFRIPKPFEIGAVATLAERSAELIFDKEMTGRMFRERVQAIIGYQLSMNPIPQMIKPIIDLYANNDSFTGRPIETMGMERLEPAYRYRGDTSLVARNLSKAGNTITGDNFLSPVQIDHLVRAYFSWLGTFVVGGADMAMRTVSNEPTRPAMDILKFATGGILSEVKGAPSKYVSQMYDQAKELEQAYGTYNNLLKQGKTDEAFKFKQSKSDELAKYKYVERVKREVSKINEKIREVERSSVSPQAKRDQITALRGKQDSLSRLVASNL